MKIIEQSRDFTAVEKYQMTKSPSIISVKNLENGAQLSPTGWLIFEDENSKGEISNMLSVIGTNAFGDTEVWSCQSQTFKDNFGDIDTMFDGAPYTIKKISGTTKSGREYVNCDLVV